MKAFIDNSLLRTITVDGAKDRNFFLTLLQKTTDEISNPSVQFMMEWPTFLQYIGLGNLFEAFPKFDVQNGLFNHAVETLGQHSEKESLFDLYDQMFIDCLSLVKALPQIDATFLINQIQKTRELVLSSHTWNPFSTSLDAYEKLLLESPKETIHSLILYLGWDRICVCLAILFEHIYHNNNVCDGLKILRDCLIESFQHISKMGTTQPSFFRLMEALYAYNMRPENLDLHTDLEWSILCESTCILMPRDALSDLYYIDCAVRCRQEAKSTDKERVTLKVFTMDSEEKVRAALGLAQSMMGKLKLESSDWACWLDFEEIICLKRTDEGLSLNTIVHPKV
jgi:hypothetical protein